MSELPPFPDPPEDKDCWEVEEYFKIEKNLMYTTTEGGYTFHWPISNLEFYKEKNKILAIKGVSDFRGDYISMIPSKMPVINSGE